MKSWSKPDGDEKKAETDEGAKPDEMKAEGAKADKPPPHDPTKAEPEMPDGWEAKKASGVKAWGEGRRTDDPDKRTVLEPLGTGVGDGRSFLFLFGLKVHSPNDRRLFEMARKHIDDDVEVLREAGFTVVIDEEATHEEMVDAFYGKGEGVDALAPAGVFWLAHGHDDGAVETSDGGVVKPSDVDPEQVHADLKLVVFAACYTGSCSQTWRNALGGKPLVVGWGRPVTIDRAVDFLTEDEETETDLDDLLRRYILGGAPVPDEVEMRYSPLASAASEGRGTDLPKRMEGTVSILRAKTLPSKEGDDALVIDVPLGEKRWHRARIFVVDGNEPFAEGELLLGVECDVGELSNVVDVPMLLAGIPQNRYARAMLVKGDKEMPNIVTQGFAPLSRVADMDAASMIFQTCQYADILEKRIFGGDSG